MAPTQQMQAIYERARLTSLAIFDVDGVLTDGGLYFTDSGEELKVFNVRDGHGMKMLQAGGVQLAIITSRQSGCVAARARNLGIDLLYQGVSDKLGAYRDLLGRLRIDAAASAYMGDDVVDLPVMRRCGLALTVADAPAPVKSRAHYVSRARGGRGAVREVCELILHAQGALQPRIMPAEPTPP